MIEEEVPTSLPEKIPGVVGKAFKASEAAFKGNSIRTRIGLLSMFIDQAKEGGVEITDAHIKDFGRMANSLTAKGKWGQMGVPKIVKFFM